jgi:RNA polymerase sigma-70 factor (ECF subfamily)
MSTDFSQAYDTHVWDVYGFLAYRTGERADAEDLTQLTFERALRSWDRFDERKATLRTWLIAIARNALVDHYRKDRGTRQEPLEGVSEESLAVEDPELGIAPELASALERLGDREREVLALRYGADLPGPDIARMLDLSLANVQQILSRTLRRLRAELDESGGRAPEARGLS